MTGGQTLVVRPAGPATGSGSWPASSRDVTGATPDMQPGDWPGHRAGQRPGRAAGLVRRLDEAGLVAAELAFRLPSLDEVFLTLTGHHAETGRSRRIAD